MAKNEYEARFRARKAIKLADTIEADGGSNREAALLTPAQRETVHALAGVKGSDQTWDVVVGILADRETRRGLPEEVIWEGLPV